MPMTPVTGATYCTPAAMLQFHDWQQCSDLLRDGDNPRPDAAAVAVSPTLALMLSAASGELDSAAIAGSRYNPSDLAILTGTGAAFLQKIVADLAFWRLQQRRQPVSADPNRVPGAMQALEALDKLRKGERIFAFAEVQDAGLPSYVDMAGGQNPNSVILQAFPLFGSHGNPYSRRRTGYY